MPELRTRARSCTAFGSPPTARVLVTHGALRARFVRGAAVLLLGAVLNFGRAEQLNTSCA
jgi:hypothetical protein